MRMYALGHQDIVENAVIVQLVAALSRIRSVQAPPEIVRFGNLTLQRFDPSSSATRCWIKRCNPPNERRRFM